DLSLAGLGKREDLLVRNSGLLAKARVQERVLANVGVEPVARVVTGPLHRSGDLARKERVDLVDDRVQDLVLRGEVVVQGTRSEPAGQCDLSHRGGLEPPLEEQVE